MNWSADALDVEPDGLFVPAHLSGVLIGSAVNTPIDLAVAVNGRIAAVTTSWTFKPGHWSAIVDPAVFHQGANRVDLVALMPDPGGGASRVPHPVAAVLGPPITGLNERGLHGVEEWPQGAVRWTDGDAEVTVPIHRSRPPRQLHLTLAGNSPEGGRLRVLANGRQVFTVRLDALKQDATWSQLIDLNGVETRDRLTVRIESSAFIPSQRNKHSLDDRRLGVAILGFELLE